MLKSHTGRESILSGFGDRSARKVNESQEFAVITGERA